MISFHDMSFRYPETEKAVLDRLSLDVPDGAFVLVVGRRVAASRPFCAA